MNKAASQLLEGRTAQCSCGATSNSSTSLPFFEFRGEGSENATKLCGACGFHVDVHNPINPSTGRPGITNHAFQPKGDVGTDKFYCGCYGWD